MGLKDLLTITVNGWALTIKIEKVIVNEGH